MPTNYPFTNAGVQDLLNKLYLLPNQELQAEADALLLHFKNWVISHFELSSSQVNDLNNLDDRTISFLASNTSFAIGNRLPVYLEKAEKKGDPEYKVVEPKGIVAVTSGSDGSFEASGEVNVKIYYKN